MTNGNGGYSRIIWWLIGGMGGIISLMTWLLITTYNERYGAMYQVDQRQTENIRVLQTTVEAIKEAREQTLGERRLILEGVAAQLDDVRRRLDRLERR